MEGLEDFPVDQELLEAASASLQAQEKLCSLFRDKLKHNTDALATKVINQGTAITDSLRELKSQIEGTHFAFQPLSLDSSELVQLKHLVISHTPDNLNDVTRAKITEKLTSILGGQVKRLLYACLLTCPWFAHSQAKGSPQAKNTLLYAVFVSRDEQFFSLATNHEKKLSDSIDEGCLSFCEARHFCAQLSKGNVRSVEALCAPPESVIFCLPDWLSLAAQVDPVALLDKTFVDLCLGQAMWAVAKKSPVSGKFTVREDATLTKFCDSFRLLWYAQAALKREPLAIWGEVGKNAEEQDVLRSLKEAFEGNIYKEHLLQLVLKMKEGLEEKVGSLPQTEAHSTSSDNLGSWLSRIRMDGVKLTSVALFPPTQPTAMTEDSLRELLASQGLSSIHPRDVLVVARAGSHMYNLATATSDVDYIVVFREPTENIISRCSLSKETHHNRGRHEEVETAAYEARLFSEMLLKAAVNMFELLYAGSWTYASDLWHELVAYRKKFMCEKVILQYIGFVKTHMKMVEKGKHAGTAREGKFFYQIFHKLLSLESFVQGGPPVVRCEGEGREFIMRIRREASQGVLAADKLYEEAKQRLLSVREQLQCRTSRFPEYGDYRILQTWLLAVRGVGLQDPLKMVTPPLLPATN